MTTGHRIGKPLTITVSIKAKGGKTAYARVEARFLEIEGFPFQFAVHKSRFNPFKGLPPRNINRYFTVSELSTGKAVFECIAPTGRAHAIERAIAMLEKLGADRVAEIIDAEPKLIANLCKRV